MRIINITEVMKVLQEKKSAKTKKHHTETTTVKKFSGKKVVVDSFLLVDLEYMDLAKKFKSLKCNAENLYIYLV